MWIKIKSLMMIKSEIYNTILIITRFPNPRATENLLDP